MSQHIATWLDHEKAHIVPLHPDTVEKSTTVARPPDGQP